MRTNVIRLLSALPLALVLMLHMEGTAATSEEPCMTQAHGMINPCAELDVSRIDDLR